MNILCVRDECPEDSALGIQLKNDSSMGVYDLIIPRVTYDQHDGLYSCYYRDAELNQTINRDYRLTVLIPPQPPTISAPIGSSQLAREGQEYQLNCTSQGGNPEPTISWFKNGELIGQPAPGFIKIEQRNTGQASTSLLNFIPTAEDHQAIYKCKVWNKAMPLESGAYEREFMLQVEYSPRLSVGLFNPLRVLQGSPVTLSCNVDANPPVKGIKWFKDGQPISNQFNHTIQEARISDAGEYTCYADNGIAPLAGSFNHHPAAALSGAGFFSILNMGSSSSSSSSSSSAAAGADSSRTGADAQLQLQVLYGPRVSVRAYQQPAAAAGNRQQMQPILNEGDSFALNCSVDASPPAFEYIWTRSDDPTFKRITSGDNTILEFSSLSASDSGNYTCTAFNRLNPSAGAGQQQALERQGSGSAMLLVRHKPGVASLELGTNGETELGSKTQLVCRAKPPGYPEPSYKFYKYHGGNGNGKIVKGPLSKQTNHGPVHVIHSAKPDDEARYGCEAFNELGSSTEADGELIVNEPPRIIPDSALSKNEDARVQGERPYSITVRASGKPVPKVSWFHRSPVDGRTIELSSMVGGEQLSSSRYEITTISHEERHNNQNRPRFTVTSTLTFKQPLEINDRGLYSVEFDNGLSRGPAQHKIQLHIHHAPIPAPKNQPILVAGSSSSSAGRSPTSSSSSGQTVSSSSSSSAVSDSQVRAGFDLGETVNLTCRVSAYPRPEFVWHDKTSAESDKPIDSNNRYRTSIFNPVDDIWESTLSFDSLQDNDYGDYLCVTANHDQQTSRLSDSIRIFVSLVRKTIPDVPTQLEAIETSQNSITLQWIPGFDGGGTNLQYQVQYAPDDGSGQSLSKRYPDTATGPIDFINSLDGPEQQLLVGPSSDQQQQFPRLQNCHSPSLCTIEHLAPRQAYLFRVRARSSMGISEFSDQLRASTRANLSQIPKILDASYDMSQNILYFRVEPNSDYLLSNLNARIEARSLVSSSSSLSDQQQQQADEQPASGTAPSSTGDWRLHSLVPLRNERAQAHLNMQPEAEQLRITLCSKSNELLCGPEFVISLRSAASSFLQDQRGLSVTMLAFSLLMIAVLGLLATSIHSCCLSRRKNKKADAIERSNGTTGSVDNKPVTTNGLHHSNHMHSQTSSSSPSNIIKGSHGSTTSTNSTSATNAANGLQSMDSIVNGVVVGGGGGIGSDHSSDHSRQAKLDSMLPPNYNHYADRASILMEQQQMQMQMQLQQQGLMASDKLSSPFGLANNALLGVANHHHHHQLPLPSPMMSNGSNYFTYGQTPMEHQQLDDSQMLGLEADKQQQQAMWPTSTGQQDEYSNYNPLAYSSAATMQNQQQEQQQQMIDPTYGTTASLMMSQQSATYDNNSNQFQSAYMSSSSAASSAAAAAAFQQQPQQQQYQQELANAQQQMYGTLTRNGGYSTTSNANNNNNNNTPGCDTSSLAHDQTILGSSSVGGGQQQKLYEQQYGTTNGLMSSNSQPQESDYGTTGARRPIREIIV